MGSRLYLRRNSVISHSLPFWTSYTNVHFACLTPQALKFLQFMKWMQRVFFFFNGQISLLRGGGWGNDWFCLQTVLNLSFFNDLSLTYFSRMARSMKLSIKGWPSQSQLSQASHVTLGKAVKLSCPKVMKGLETDWIPVLNTSQSTHEILKVLVSHL